MALLVGAGMVAAFHIGKVPPALPSIRRDLGASLSEAGWLLSVVNLITALGGMAIALTADRIGQRRLAILGTALCTLTSLLGGFVGTVSALVAVRALEGIGFISVVVALPPLILRIVRANDQRAAMTLWSCYMPAGAGAMMLIAALLPWAASWRTIWLVAAAASAAMLVALLLGARRRRELDLAPTQHLPVLIEMRDVASSGGPLAIAVCFAAYSACWYVVVGFLPTLQVERLGYSPSTAALVTALVTVSNVLGNLSGGWLLQRNVPRAVVIVGAALSMAVCAAGIFVSGVPDPLRLVLAGLYSAVIGAVAAALFAAIPVHAPHHAGAATGLLMQGSNMGSLVGPPITAALVSAGGWPAAAWLTSSALAIVIVAAVFLHWRERRKVAT